MENFHGTGEVAILPVNLCSLDSNRETINATGTFQDAAADHTSSRFN